MASFCEQSSESLGCVKMGHSLTYFHDEIFNLWFRDLVRLCKLLNY
jgi:hypothetical protein